MSTVRRFATRTVRNVSLVSENEKSERVTEKFNVVYRSYSQRLIEEIEAVELAEGKTTTIPFSAYLSHQVVRIYVPADPDVQESRDEDITADDGKPVVFYDGTDEETLIKARDFFGGSSINDVTKTLFDAIEGDINPQKASPEPGPSGSPAADSEA